MQKNYRDYTIGELLDMGVNVSVRNHNVHEDEANQFVNQFEGIKRSSDNLKTGQHLIKGWKKKFEIVCFCK
ncbi:hypothetical protein SAMN05192534_12313 [Alteribacillus persepolensis]|uniref:Uncharacterized protein n=1 Tax=Alteribacillus persepolensis TaxID=568899 RepID=A0A1G8I6C1_9BACI|nr:hypothetical protein [Alteribacillus persepolensis]SDI14519.1 hypothetical protein SAMN05192534_12313 [Alteribacillus persepolensis]